MEEKTYQAMMKKLEGKFPHGSRRGRRNGVVPKVSLVDWAKKAGLARTQLLMLLRSGTQRMSLTVAMRLGQAFGHKDYGEVEAFVNEVARRNKEKDKGSVGMVEASVNPSTPPSPSPLG